MDMTRFGAWLRHERTSRNWTQEHLARLIDRDQRFVSDIESGVRAQPLDPADFAALARALRVDEVELYEAAGYLRASDDLTPPDGLTFYSWINELDDVQDLGDEAKEGFKTLARLVNRAEQGG